MKKLNVCLVFAWLLFQCTQKEVVKPQIQEAVPKADISARSAATTFYVSPTGNDAADGSAAHPWKTLRYAVSKTPANLDYTIQLTAGTFVENGLIEVPLGVSIFGAGIDQTILKAAASFYYYPTQPAYATDKFLISLNEYNQLPGNQTLSGFTIDGDGKKLHGGIYVRHRNNVTIDSVKVINTHYMGVWLWDVQKSFVRNSQIINSSWGSTGYCVGALNLGNLDRVEISNLKVDENTGYGIKAIGPSGGNNIFNTTIHDSRISVSPVGQWNSGSAPNIAIELWQINLVGCQIYNNYIDNTISLVNNTGIPANGIQTMRVHHNTLDMDTRAHGAGYGIELTINDAEIDHNYFIKGTYGMANWANPMKNWSIHHNTFYALQNTYPGDIVRSQWSGLHNVKLYNNTVEFVGTKTMNIVGLYGGSSDNVDIKNNLLIDNSTSYSYYPDQLVHLENGAALSVLTVKNNLFQRLPVGSVAGTYADNLTANPLISQTGSRPDAYYAAKSGSPLIDRGLNVGFTFLGAAPDIGAAEYGAGGNSLPQVSISSPVNNAKLTSGSSITISANASDTDGTISKVEFFNGSTLLGQDLIAPFSFLWSNVPTGNYSLTVRATDNQNGITTSTAVAISVAAGSTNQPPVVSLTSPVTNSVFASGTSVTLTATATDADGSIAKVEFFNGATKLGEDLTSPYSFVWSAALGTLSARATDNSGATSMSNSVTVTISGPNHRQILDSNTAVLSGKMVQGYDGLAQGGSFFYVAPGSGTNYYIPPPGAAAFNVQVPTSDNYTIWAKVKSPTSSTQSSYIYNGKGKWFTWSAGIHSSWTWVKITDSGAPALFPFSQGANQFQIAWYNENVQVDQIAITNDPNYAP